MSETRRGNYTVLQDNIMLQFQTDEACAAFLWACDLPGNDRYLYKPEAFAREVDHLAQTVWAMIVMVAENHTKHTGQDVSDFTLEDLFRYIMDRHTFHRHPGRKEGYWPFVPEYEDRAS